MIVDNKNFATVGGIFPRDLLGELQALANDQEERKKSFDLSSGDCPDQVVQAAQFLQRILDVRINTGIVKRYRLDDPTPSGAYVAHPDPDHFAGEPIEIVSLDGQATLSAETPLGSRDVACVTNTLVTMDSTIPHWVTPPSNPDGVRHILFFGFDSTKPAITS